MASEESLRKDGYIIEDRVIENFSMKAGVVGPLFRAFVFFESGGKLFDILTWYYQNYLEKTYFNDISEGGLKIGMKVRIAFKTDHYGLLESNEPIYIGGQDKDAWVKVG